jgi:hypothetical protein
MNESGHLRQAQRRVAALTRDEGRLREALAAQSARRFDLDAIALVKARTTEMIETLRAVADDDRFWSELATDNPPSAERLNELSLIDGSAAAFELLLVASGYKDPPPPSAQETVDGVLDELADALAFRRDEAERLAALKGARSGLRQRLWRIGRDLDTAPDPAENPQLVVRCGRSAAAAARWLIPKAVALAAGIIVEVSTVPGSGVGALVAAAAKKIIEDGVELAAERVVDRLAIPGQDAIPSTPEQLDGPLAIPAIVAVHIAAIADALATLRRTPTPPTPLARPTEDEIAARRTALTNAHRHLLRVNELLTDHDLRLGEDTQALLDQMAELLAVVVNDLDNPYRSTQNALDAELADLGQQARGANTDPAEQDPPIGFFGGSV